MHEEQDAGDEENDGEANQLLHRGTLVIPDQHLVALQSQLFNFTIGQRRRVSLLATVV